MRIVKTITQLRRRIAAARAAGQSIGFVPTMGYFHEGHLTLMRRAKKECGFCVVSVYVNPKQFGPGEDFCRYPRDLRRDALLAEKENVDILFIPSDNGLYPYGYLTYIDVEKISKTLCGRFRPGHFKGVATVVAKLLNVVQPDIMFLGQKDAQQVALLRRMAADLNFSATIRMVATVREKDGLAKSSRNVFLSGQQRREAPIVHEALSQAALRITAGERSPARITRFIKGLITRRSSGKIQYVACVDADTLDPLKELKGRVLIALAVFFGKTRLIDNGIVTVKEKRKAAHHQGRDPRLRGHRLPHRQKH